MDTEIDDLLAYDIIIPEPSEDMITLPEEPQTQLAQVEFVSFDVNPIVTALNPNCSVYVRLVQQTFGSDTMITLDEKSLITRVTECQTNVLSELDRNSSEELTGKLCSAVLERHRIVCAHLRKNVDLYNNYCEYAKTQPCEQFFNAYSQYQKFLNTFNDAEIYLRNYLVFVLDEIFKLSKKSKGNHPKVLPKSATQILWDWFLANYRSPYPTESVKQNLSDQTGLTIKQINNWMDNHRRRYPEWKQGIAPMVQNKGPRLRTHDEEHHDPIVVVSPVSMDEIFGEETTIFKEEELQVVPVLVGSPESSPRLEIKHVSHDCGPSKEEARTIRAHSLLIALRSSNLLQISEEKFQEVIQKFRTNVLDEYEGCSVIESENALELWHEATMKYLHNRLKYEREVDLQDELNGQKLYQDLILENQTVERDLWEALISAP
jgi:hypothetical protein